MTSTDWAARAEAYREAAGHLELAWTEDKQEREQGMIVAKLLNRDADRCQRIASDPYTPKAKP